MSWLHGVVLVNIVSFQFQYGAIVRLLDFHNGYVTYKFQFQYGAIVRKENDVAAINEQLFQFQYGPIVRIMMLSGIIHDSEISIPVWCDWEDINNATIEFNNVFQFQYGAIGSSRLIQEASFLFEFQFQYGAIGSK